jgi:hypothetical protein
MSGFLTHLASVALGRTVEGAARPSLPPRFAPLEADGPIAEAGEERVEPGPAPSAAPAAARPAIAAPAASDRDPARIVAPPGEPAPLPASEPSAVPTAPSTGQGASRPPEAGQANPRRKPARPTVPSAIPSTDVLDSRAGSLEPAAPPAPLPRLREAGPVRSTSVQAPRRAQTPAASPTPLAPLSDGAIAGRTETRRTPAPVIHVTIDRIDVRAPAPPRPAPPTRRAPAEPSLSLSEFLAAGSPRPRQ